MNIALSKVALLVCFPVVADHGFLNQIKTGVGRTRLSGENRFQFSSG